MKRLFALLLAAAMCFALLSGCGGNTTESPAGSADASEAAEASTPETDTAEEAEAAEGGGRKRHRGVLVPGGGQRTAADC